MTTAIWWVRRDLRLTDNQALTAAMDAADAVIPLFVLDPILLSSPYVSEKRLAFLYEGLRSLDHNLRKRRSRLMVRRGEPATVLQHILEETGASSIYAEDDVSPFSRKRDARVGYELPLHLLEGVTVHPADAVLKSGGDPYTVYTPYSRAWKSLPLPGEDAILPAPTALRTPMRYLSDGIPERPVLPESVPFQAGEAAARARLVAFVDQTVYAYKAERDRMDLDATSRLSPYLRFGMISARQAVVAALSAREAAETDEARRGATTWLNELIWREFYISILYHFPKVRQESFRAAYRHLAWLNDPDAFEVWRTGRTGYPVVDAAMRQLEVTGWMHNRARMIVASFLTKDLLIDWRWGERHFMQHLIDGDPSANNGGWQWSAGTGTDAAPYFRIFNPTLQGRKHDPEGTYIRRWVPELRGVSNRYIHEPRMMSDAEQSKAACIMGRDYPMPIVDHKIARERTLAAYKGARERHG